jgi:hypothetical protein
MDTPMNPRGRPKLAADEKGNYNPVLVGEEVLKTLQITSEKPEEPAALQSKLTTLKEHPEACEYYWKLVFTYSYFVYKNRRLTDAIFERTDTATLETIKKMNLKQLAEIVGIEYHNFKNMYSGRGNAKNLLHYQSFLYQNGVNFISLQYTDSLINKAYSYYQLLQSDKYTGEELKNLFF